MKTAVTNTTVWRKRSFEEASDLLAVEEPLQIRLEYGSRADRRSIDLAVTMRTPGNDFELTVGFLFTESIIRASSDILFIRYCDKINDPDERDNVVKVGLHPHVNFDLGHLRRNFFTTSSCGVCGKQSISQVVKKCTKLPMGRKFSIEHLVDAPEILRENQNVFEHTGGLHACGLFDSEGKLLLLREDVGRHNALDKLIGASLEMNMIPLYNHFLVVSGRASFELVQKTIMAGVPVMVAVGAPSSLAVQLAKTQGLTLMGFVRKGDFNVYTNKNRL